MKHPHVLLTQPVKAKLQHGASLQSCAQALLIGEVQGMFPGFTQTGSQETLMITSNPPHQKKALYYFDLICNNRRLNKVSQVKTNAANQQKTI